MLAPIVLFVYNRPVHTRKTLESLTKNRLSKQSILYIFADGQRLGAEKQDKENISQVRKIVREKKWCKQVIVYESKKNIGLAQSIIHGVTEIINKHGRVIVLEDDLELSPGFLNYMNEALEIYKNEDKVMHVSGYFPSAKGDLPETFFYNQTSCWGWGTWKRAWMSFNPKANELLELFDTKKKIKQFNLGGAYDFYSHLKMNAEGKMKTWAILWHASVTIKHGLCLHPRLSLVRNIGFDGSGIHCSKDDDYFKQDIAETISVDKIPLIESLEARKAVANYYFDKSGWWQRLWSKVR